MELVSDEEETKIKYNKLWEAFGISSKEQSQAEQKGKSLSGSLNAK